MHIGKVELVELLKQVGVQGIGVTVHCRGKWRSTWQGQHQLATVEMLTCIRYWLHMPQRLCLQLMLPARLPIHPFTCVPYHYFSCPLISLYLPFFNTEIACPFSLHASRKPVKGEMRMPTRSAPTASTTALTTSRANLHRQNVQKSIETNSQH